MLDWAVEVWQAPIAGEERSFDRVVVGTSAIAVLDAAVNTNLPNAEAIADSAIAHVASAVTARGIAAGLDEAARRIHNPDASWRHRNGLVAFVGIQPADSELRAWRNADCELWYRVGDRWQSLFPEHMLTPLGKEIYDAGPPTSDITWWSFQERSLDRLHLWNSPTIGLASAAYPTARAIPEEAEELVLSSDGAQLTPSRLAELESWLAEGIHNQPLTGGHRSPHGDVSVVRLSRRAHPR